MKRLFTRCQEQVAISSAAPFPPVEECERSAVRTRGWGMDKGIIEAIALETVWEFTKDSCYTPYLPDLRIRFSATSEEVMAGVGLAERIVAFYY